MKVVSASELTTTDLIVDALYQGGRSGNAGDDPFPRLLGMSNQGGFRYRGDLRTKLEMLLLTSSLADPDWPDSLDRESGVFTYFGDNKEPGRGLHETGRRGNELLRQVFEDAQAGPEGRQRVPPIFIFSGSGTWRDGIFLGLVVPGASDLTLADDLVAVWRTKSGKRFQNYRARFTVLDAPVVNRVWIDSIITGEPLDSTAPLAWRRWVATGARRPLIAPRSLEHRTKMEQLPEDEVGRLLIQLVRDHFLPRPHDFEHFAGAIARLMLPDVEALDVTRPSRDGGRDATGQLRIGRGASAILVDFALEAKCYSLPNSVGVREVSRLISRLRHRQFGILVTTTWVDLQAYKEIKEDRHPIVVISAVDVVGLLRGIGRGTPADLAAWLNSEFPASRGGNH
jgi:Restriction endonuclease AspBHI N-terminal/Restriction endonuclease